MPEISRTDIETAVRDLQAARDATIDGLDLKDPDDPSQPYPRPTLPGPASPDAIARAERALAVRLPPSYRHFLSLHDGLEDYDLGSDLLGAEALARFNQGSAVGVLEGILDEIERDSAKGLIVFCTAKSDNSMVLFDSNKADKFGEWTVIEYDVEEGMLDEYDDFLEFLKDSADTVRQMAPAPSVRSQRPSSQSARTKESKAGKTKAGK